MKLLRISVFFKGIWDNSNRFSEVAEYYGVPQWCLYMDALRCRLLHGTDIGKYLSAGMYKMSHLERKTVVNGVRTKKIEKIFNTNPNKVQMIDNKCQFNRDLSQFIHHEWLYGPDSSDEEIISFLNRYEKVMVKPPMSNMGKGVRCIPSQEAVADAKAFICEVREQKLMLEEYIRQHDKMASINPTSVNTIRIVTVRDRQGEVHIIGASLRAGGKGAVVDNFHADGVQYPIDPATGIITGCGTRIDGTKNIVFHPASGIQMVGFCVPNWEMILCDIKKAAQIPKDIRYLGWDIAVTPVGYDIVEANINQGSNGMQLDGVGKYRIIMQYL